MPVRALAARVHRWMGLLVGVQVLLWIAGGVVMSVLPIEEVRSEHKLAEHAPLAYDPSELISLEDAARGAGIATVTAGRLDQVAGRPVWVLEASEGSETSVDAASGQVLSPFGADHAARVALHDLAIEASIVAVERLEKPVGEYAGPLPAWRVRFDDGDATTLYVAAGSGQVRARRSTTWRFYDLFWRLHVMDYDDGADFNHPLLITAALSALLFALAGIALLYTRMRQVWLVRAGVRARREAPSGG